MEICSVCGNQNTNNTRFCQECGTPYPGKVNEAPPTPNVPTGNVDPQQAPKSRTKMSKKNKIIFGAIAAVAALLIGAHLFIQQAIDPYKQLAKADRAFVAKDSEEFLSYFSMDDKVIADADGFYAFMEEKDWTDTISPAIKDMIKGIENGTYSKPIVDEYDNKLISVVDEKFLLFYKKVVVKVEPIKVTASTSVPSVKVSISEDKDFTVKEDEETSIGLFTPGEHKFDVTLKDDLGENTIKQAYLIEGEGDNTYELDFDFTDQTLEITSDYEDAIVWIDGKSTKKTASELNIATIPFDESVEMQAVITVDGKEKKSEAVKVADRYVHLPFADVQQKLQAEQKKREKQQAIDDFYDEYGDDARTLYEDFRHFYHYALSNIDFSYVSGYLADGTQVKKNFENFVLEHHTYDYSYDYDFITNEITDLEAVSKDTFNLYSYEVFDYYTSTNDNLRYERKKKYTIKLIDNELKITNVEDVSKVKKTEI